MKQQDWITKHDLSLTFDGTGRFWKFRPTTSAHGSDAVDAEHRRQHHRDHRHRARASSPATSTSA